jgi:uncharacterized membrane protein YccF (DUF307 family)
MLFYIGIYDELYQELEKNKLWFSDGSFSISLVFLFVSIICLIYIFKHFSKKKINLNNQDVSLVLQKLELIKHDKNYKDYWF